MISECQQWNLPHALNPGETYDIDFIADNPGEGYFIVMNFIIQLILM